MTYSIDITSYRSPNYNQRSQSISAILIHTDEGTRQSSIPWLCNPHTADPRLNTSKDPRVSSNYYVCRDGAIFQVVPDQFRAWHSGPGLYAGISDWNSASIGIECEHKEGQDWPQVQLDALAWLCRTKIAQYHILVAQIAAHRWVAPTRKSDPTDWPDAELRRWIAALYVPTLPSGNADRWAQWGTSYPLDSVARGYAIPQLWFDNAGWLGAACSGELWNPDGDRCVQWFTGGHVIYDKRGDSVQMFRRLTRGQ